MAKKELFYILIALAIAAVIFLPGFSKLQGLKEEKRNLERRIEVLKRANRELRSEKEKLENDPTYAEKIAREKLGMSRQGEIVLK